MTGYDRSEADFAAADRFRRDARASSLAPKDYSVPLHVDCSIEYELPDCAKPPQGVKIEPLLMIHPSHFRRLESLRRVPFVNNLPRGEAGAAAAVTATAAVPDGRSRAARQVRRCCRAAPAPPVPHAQPQPARVHHAQVAQEVQRHRSTAAVAAAAAAEEQRQRAALTCYRFETYATESCGIAGGGKLGRTRLKVHPYLPAAADALDCDIVRALPTAATHYDRFDDHALRQLPIYM